MPLFLEDGSGYIILEDASGRILLEDEGLTNTVSPSTGHLTLTGYAPTVSQSGAVTIAPTTGHLTFTGYVPTVTQATVTTVAPSTGHLTLTGKTPTITQTFVIAPSTGHLTITGYAPDVSQTGATTTDVNPLTGHLTLSGYAPEVTQTSPNTQDTHDGVGGFRQSRRTAKALEEARRKRWEEEVADVRALADQLRGLPVQVGALERVEQVIAQPAVREPVESVPDARWDEWLAELDRVRQDVRALLQRLQDEAQEWEEAAMLVALMDGATPEFPPSEDEIEYRMLMEAL